MIMLSDLLRYSVSSKNQSGGKLVDLSVALLEEDYPLVTHLFFLNERKKLLRLKWSVVKSFDSRMRQIEVADLSAAEEIPAPSSTADDQGKVLLKRDVLDALILDLQGRTTTRANDLALDEESGGGGGGAGGGSWPPQLKMLRVRAVDVSFSAILRRVSFGLYRHLNEKKLYDWKYVEFLRGDPDAVESGAGYNMRIARLPAGEIASLSVYLPYLHAAELLRLLPDEKAADVLEAMTIERQVQIIEEFKEKEAVTLLNLMSPDLAADLLRRLQTPTMKHYLEVLPQKQRARIIELLGYPEETVGGVMVNDIVWICADLTVAEARTKLREPLKEPDFVALIFLVDDEKKRCLRGAISLKQLLTENDDWKLEKVMDPFIETLNPQESAKKAAYRIIDGQLQAMPVVDDHKKLLGAMTIDAAIAQIAVKSNLQGMRVFS